MSRVTEKRGVLTDRDRNALVSRLRESRIAAGWADEVQHSGASTISELVAAATAVADGRAQGGQARAVARVAKAVFLAYARERGAEGTSRAVPVVLRTAAVDHSLTPHQRRLAEGRDDRLGRRRGKAADRHSVTLDEVDGLLTALALMGEDAAEDPLYRLARQHVEHGFLLPPEVEDLVRKRVQGGDLKSLGEAELDTHRVALLKYAVAGLRRRGRDIGYVMIEKWDREGRLRVRDRQIVESLLWEARNDRA